MRKGMGKWIAVLSVVAVALVGFGILGCVASGGHAGTMGYGMMGGWLGSNSQVNGPAAVAITNERAVEIAKQYVSGFGDPSLELAEVMVFDNHYYGEARDRQTGLYAFEFLVDRFSGRVSPEPGPNMMWNQAYGHMMASWGFPRASRGGGMPVSAGDAISRAQQYLDRYAPGLRVEDKASEFPGYYTLDTERDGVVAGMLSVNGYTGDVWVHGWHGAYLGEAYGEEQ